MGEKKLTQEELLKVFQECWNQSVFYQDRETQRAWIKQREQAYAQLKEMIQQKPTVTMKEIENAVGDTSEEYTEGVVELFEWKGFEIAR